MPGGREFECVFETDERGVPETIGRDKAEEIDMEWIMSSHGGPQMGSIESVSLWQKPIPGRLVAVADTTERPIPAPAVGGGSAKRRRRGAESGERM